MGMARLRDAKVNVRKRPGWDQAKTRIAGTESFLGNITNYSLYFRLIAFVNSDILAPSCGNALAQAGGVTDGGTSRRPQT